MMTSDNAPPTAFQEFARKALMATALVVAISPMVALGSLHGQKAGLFTTDPTAKAAAATSLAITVAGSDLDAHQRVTARINGPVSVAGTNPKHHLLAEPVVALTPETITPKAAVVEALVTAVPAAKPVTESGNTTAQAPQEQTPVASGKERLVFANRIDNMTVATTPTAEAVKAIPEAVDQTIGAAAADELPVEEVALTTALLLPPNSEVTAEQPAWLRHAVAVDLSSNRPKIAVVIDDLGLSKSRTKATMALPGPLTMAFLPYASDLHAQSDAARQAGHELLVHLPMQPLSDSQDPGPKALRTDLSKDELLRRLRSALASFDGYVGINNHMGSKFTSDPNGMLVILQELKRRGLMFLDSQTSNNSVAGDLAESLGMPSAKRSVFIDHDQDALSVRRSLNQLEVTARHFGVAVGIGHPHRVTLDALAEWLPGLEERGFELVPISAVAKMRMERDRPSQVAARN